MNSVWVSTNISYFGNVLTIALLFIGHICPTNTTKQGDLTAEGQVRLLFESRS